MIVGEDHKGRVKGVGGVCVGAKKVFGENAYSSAPKNKSDVDEDMEKKLQELVDKRVQSQFKSLLEHIGMSNVEALIKFQPPQDKASHHDIPDGTSSLDPPIPDVEVNIIFLYLNKVILIIYSRIT